MTPPPPQLVAAPPPDAVVPDAGADASAPSPRYLIGENCLNKRLRTTHLFPRFLGGGGDWEGDPDAVSVPLREAPQRFTVLGFDGMKRGEMATDANSVGTDPRGFLGTYSGSVGVCGFRRDGIRGGMMDCVKAGGCGLAIAVVGDTIPPTKPIRHDRRDHVCCGWQADRRSRSRREPRGVPARRAPRSDGDRRRYLLRPGLPGALQLVRDCARVRSRRRPRRRRLRSRRAFELVIAIRSGTSRSVAMYGTHETSNRLRRLAHVLR